MIEINKKDFDVVLPLTDTLTYDKVYPMSVLQGYQEGRVMVDKVTNPTCALIWHYCGFGYLAGEPDNDFLSETAQYIREEKEPRQKRLALQTNVQAHDDFFSAQKGIVRYDRQRFRFTGKEYDINNKVPDNMQLIPIDESILMRLTGMVIPKFSWSNSNEFLSKGKGFCLLCGNDIAASAFSAAISDMEIDIGIETNENYRRQGLGKIVAARMISYVRSLGKAPLWECVTANTGSNAIAHSIGFEPITKTGFFKKK